MRKFNTQWLEGRPRNASSLFAGYYPAEWQGNGNVIKNGNAYLKYESEHDWWVTSPDDPRWRFPEDPPSRAFRSRGQNFAVIGFRITQKNYINRWSYTGPFFAYEQAVAWRSSRFFETYPDATKPYDSSKDYIPCDNVLICYGWQSDGDPYSDPPKPETERKALYVRWTTTNSDPWPDFSPGNYYYVIHPPGWEPEDDGMTVCLGPNNESMPYERAGWWVAYEGSDITDQSLTWRWDGGIGLGASSYARDAELDPEVSMEWGNDYEGYPNLERYNYIAFNPQLTDGPPYRIEKMTAELKVFIRFDGSQCWDKCAFMGANYNVTFTAEKFTCTLAPIEDRGDTGRIFEASSNGQVEKTYSYTVTESTEVNTEIEIGSFEFDPSENEAFKIKDFFLTSATRP